MAGSASSVAARNRKLSLQEIFLHSQGTIIRILAYRVKTRIRTDGRRTTTDGLDGRTDGQSYPRFIQNDKTRICFKKRFSFNRYNYVQV
jgi:hypothetical protein